MGSEVPCFRRVFAGILGSSGVWCWQSVYYRPCECGPWIEARSAATEGRVGTPLELAFESRELRDICESEAEARRHLGDSVAEMLKHRLADLDAASSPKDLLVGQPRLGADTETMVIDLCEGHRLVFTANHPNNPTTPDGKLDWTRVRRIRILRIESEHA
jgi:hypothetical protein